jgi:FkbM family methyltransferase|tara:strand:+ start:1059 stop:1715 length:657 start_codon:yes stop_codon:yes gene_type:complete
VKKKEIEELDSWFPTICDEVKNSWGELPLDCRGGTVIDCGANVGAFPVIFNVRFDKYICYEADPNNCEYAEKNLKRLPFPNNFDLSRICTFENKACYKNSVSTVPIYKHSRGLSGDSSIYSGKDHLKKNKIADVPTVSVEDIKEKYFCDKCQVPIRLLKCDIEGAEYDFLLGKDLSIFEFICIEIHYEEVLFHEMVSFIQNTHEIIVVDRLLFGKLKK